jgi:glycolate oxidase iron-sulfur subunit
MREEKIKEQIRKCAKCGACRSVCPLVEVDQMETAVARGKIEVIRRDLGGELSATDAAIREFLDNCLLCGRCENRCPNQVKTVQIFSHARANHTSYGEMFFGKKALVKSLGLSSSSIKAASLVGKGLLSILTEKIPSSSGIFYRFPTLTQKEGRMFPEIPRQSFLDLRGKSIHDFAGQEADLLFTGCLFNYIYPSVLEKTHGTITGDGEGKTFGAPAEQNCCGLPALGAGDLKGAMELGEKNIKLFQQVRKGTIVFPCGSCFYMVKKVYPDLFAGTELHGPSLDLADRCRDYESYLVDLAVRNLKPSPACEGQTVAYHRPCHLVSIPGAIERAEFLLSGVLGERFVAMKGADKCCGFGGTFNLVKYQKSINMGLSKVKLAEESGADILATSCSGCINHLSESVARSRSRIRVMHVGELFDI